MDSTWPTHIPYKISELSYLILNWAYLGWCDIDVSGYEYKQITIKLILPINILII